MARNHTAILDAAGLTLEDIVSGYVYLQDMKDYQDMNAIYQPVLLTRSWRSNLPDALRGSRQDHPARPGLVHRREDASVVGTGQNRKQPGSQVRHLPDAILIPFQRSRSHGPT